MARSRRPLRSAVVAGARRAGLHLLRAGYEVVAGAGAFLDEVVRARRANDDPSRGDEAPVRIRVD